MKRKKVYDVWVDTGDAAVCQKSFFEQNSAYDYADELRDKYKGSAVYVQQHFEAVDDDE